MISQIASGALRGGRRRAVIVAASLLTCGVPLRLAAQTSCGWVNAIPAASTITVSPANCYVLVGTTTPQESITLG